MGKKRKAAEDQGILAGLEQCAQLWKLTDAQTAALLAFFAERKSVQLTRESFADLLSAVSPPDDIKLQMKQLFCPQFGILTAEEEFALEAEIRQLPVTIDPPEPTTAADTAARWILNPAVMVSDLTDALNEVLKLCRHELADGYIIQVKPEYLNGSAINNKMDLSVALIFLGFASKAVTVRNTIEMTPFRPETIRDVQGTAFKNGLKFDDAIQAFTNELRLLSDWSATIQQIRKTSKGKGSKAPTNTPPEVVIEVIGHIEALRASHGGKPKRETLQKRLKQHGIKLNTKAIGKILAECPN